MSARNSAKKRNETEHEFDGELQAPSTAQDTAAPSPEIDASNGDMDWRRASSLATPPPRPGMSQRWVRVGMKGEDDARNVSGKLSEGWKPRPASTVQEGYSPPTIRHGRLGEVIGVDGMILFEIPTAKLEARRRYTDARTNKQMQSIREDLRRVSDPSNPITVDHQSSVSHQGPRVAQIASD